MMKHIYISIVCLSFVPMAVQAAAESSGEMYDPLDEIHEKPQARELFEKSTADQREELIELLAREAAQDKMQAAFPRVFSLSDAELAAQRKQAFCVRPAVKEIPMLGGWYKTIAEYKIPLR